MTRPAAGPRGQATTETMIMMMFLLLLIFGTVHMSMLAATKSLVNYAAFAGARTAMIGASSFKTRLAVLEVMDAGARWNRALNYACIGIGFCVDEDETRTIRGKERTGVLVTYRVPFGLPIFNDIPFGGIALKGFAPMSKQPDIEEKGDNRER